MTNITIAVEGASARTVRREGALTSGMVGATAAFCFGPEWEGLTKTAVFKAGNVTRDVVGIDTVARIPPEVLERSGKLLYAGVYGVNGAGDLVIPTAWAAVGNIQAGADPSGDESTDPQLPVWAQLQADIEKLKQYGPGGGSISVSAEGDALVITTTMSITTEGDAIIIGGA